MLFAAQDEYDNCVLEGVAEVRQTVDRPSRVDPLLRRLLFQSDDVTGRFLELLYVGGVEDFSE